MDNREIARALVEGLWAGRLPEANEHPGYWPGLHTFDYVRNAFSDLSATIKHQVAEGDLVVTHVELTGMHTGPFLGAQPTSHKVIWSVIYLDRFEDGKAVEHASGDGWMDVLMTIGAIPPPG